jgi:type I restriction enzyme S subunit
MNVGEVKCLAVPLPPTKEQSQVTKTVEDQLSIVSAVESSLQTAKYRSNSLRQAILKRAFEGNLLNAETKTAAAG